VKTSNKLAKITCATVLAGDNVLIWNQPFTAIASGATPATAGEFSIGADDTACGLALANAINRHPSLAGRIRAVSVLGVVYIGAPDDRTPSAVERVTASSSTTIAINTPTLTAGAFTMLFANDWGVVGNFITNVATGTNVTAYTNGTAGQFGSGTGGAVPTFTQDVLP